MKNCLLIISLIFLTSFVTKQKVPTAYQGGEWFKFKISYSGFLKAGSAELVVKEKKLKGNPVYHVVGKGWTTGAIKWFFKVDDHYETYIDKETGLPQKFIRKIDEGGYTKDLEVDFDHQNQKAYVEDKKNKTNEVFTTKKNVQDMVSAFYYLRNSYDTDNIREGDLVKLNMFIDDENFDFQLMFLERETLDTDFGKIRALKFRPYVKADRVFKQQDGLTIWISDDANKIPLRVKADLVVGSLRADLEAFKGLKHSFKKEFD